MNTFWLILNEFTCFRFLMDCFCFYLTDSQSYCCFSFLGLICKYTFYFNNVQFFNEHPIFLTFPLSDSFPVGQLSAICPLLKWTNSG